MHTELQSLLNELEVFGKTNDLKASNRQQKMLNITPDTGVFLSIVIQASRAKRILEIGTSNGYSTLWLAHAASKTGGNVTTIEVQDHKVKKSKENFARSGLAHTIEIIHGDAGHFLRTASQNFFDLIFLDSDRDQYEGWWSDLKRVLAPGALLVVDNAISHESELASFRALIGKDNFETSLIPIGNGELMVLKPL